MDQYNRTLQDLLKRIEQLRRENRRELDKQQRIYETNLKRLEKKMLLKSQKEREEIEKEYKRQMHEYERFIRGEIKNLDRQLQNEIRKKNKEIQTLKNRMKAIEKALQDDIQDLKKNLQDDLDRKKKIARNYEVEFKQVLKGFDILPHLKFTPQKLDTISSIQNNMDTLDASEMYEAKAAIAISGTSSLHRLEIEVEECAGIWKREYALYKQYVSYLYCTIQHHLALWQADFSKKYEEKGVNDDFYQDVFDDNQWNLIKEIDYWAFGKYRCHFEKLKEEMELIQEIESVSIDKYLLDETSIALNTVSQKNDDLHDILEKLSAIFNKAMDNQQKYKERQKMMKNILDEFEIRRHVQKVGISLERPRDDSSQEYVDYKILAKNLKGDLRRSMHGILHCQSDVYIHIYIKVEDLKDRYRNVMILYDDFGENQGYLASMEQDDYRMLIGILNDYDLQIDSHGYEQNDNWYVPFVNLENISQMQSSDDLEIVKFAGKLNVLIKAR